MWTKGKIDILGAQFRDGIATGVGDVEMSGNDSTTIVAGGVFEGNRASNGGVVYVESDSELAVSGGVFRGNEADTSGGAFFVGINGKIKVREGQLIITLWFISLIVRYEHNYVRFGPAFVPVSS